MVAATIFPKKFRQSPHNIVVKHFDRRVVRRDESTGALGHSADLSNTYYHPSPVHIMRKDPVFDCSVASSNSSFLSVLQTSQVLHISMNAQMTYEPIVNLFVTVLFIKLQNICVTVLYSYKKYRRIVRFSYVNGMMHGLDGLSISLMHNNFLITYLLLLFI